MACSSCNDSAGTAGDPGDPLVTVGPDDPFPGADETPELPGPGPLSPTPLSSSPCHLEISIVEPPQDPGNTRIVRVICAGGDLHRWHAGSGGTGDILSSGDTECNGGIVIDDPFSNIYIEGPFGGADPRIRVEEYDEDGNQIGAWSQEYEVDSQGQPCLSLAPYCTFTGLVLGSELVTGDRGVNITSAHGRSTFGDDRDLIRIRGGPVGFDPDATFDFDSGEIQVGTIQHSLDAFVQDLTGTPITQQQLDDEVYSCNRAEETPREYRARYKYNPDFTLNNTWSPAVPTDQHDMVKPF